MGLFSKTESYLGIDIGADGMKLVELKKTKGRPQLWTYGIVEDTLDVHPAIAEKSAETLVLETQGEKDVSPDDAVVIAPDEARIDHYAGMLRELVSASHAVSRHATASLPVSQIFHAVLTLPVVPEKEITHDVQAKVAKMLPQPIEEMQVVHQVIPNQQQPDKQHDIKVLVTAAPKKLVSFYSTIFQRAGLTLDALETEAFALERSLVGRDTATVMVIDVGAERTNLFIMDQGLPMTHRTIQTGGREIDIILAKTLGISQEIVPHVKHDLSRGAQIPDAIFVPVLDPIVKESQYDFDLFLSQSGNQGKRPEKIIFTGGASLFPPLVPFVAKQTRMKVFVGDPWARVVYQDSLRRVIDPIGPRMAVAIGLALRSIT